MMTRITKRTARKMFERGEVFYACPRKMRPDGPFSMACPIHGIEWKEYADKCRNLADGPGTYNNAWDSMMNNWKYYNASYETGYYPHYYVEK